MAHLNRHLWPLAVVICLLVTSYPASADHSWNIGAKAKTKSEAEMHTPRWHMEEASDDAALLSSFQAMFTDWKAHYSKAYASPSAEAKAFDTWVQSMRSVASINHDKDKTWFASGNFFSDMDPETLAQRHLTNPASLERGMATLTTRRTNDTLMSAANRKLLRQSLTGRRKLLSPDAVDWRREGKVTPVKDQGACGSCWGACAASAVESAYLISQGLRSEDVPDFILSHQQLYDCASDGRYVNQRGGNMGPACDGGGSDFGVDYAADHRLGTTTVYPLEDRPDVYSCKEDSVGPGDGVRFDGQAYEVVSQGDEDALMEAVARVPVIAYFSCGTSFWAYTSGLYTEDDCPKDAMNHAMLIVGYDRGAGEWILKNSWATWGWGHAEGGYIRVPMRGNGDGFCLMQRYNIYPSLNFVETWGGAPTKAAATISARTAAREEERVASSPPPSPPHPPPPSPPRPSPPSPHPPPPPTPSPLPSPSPPPPPSPMPASTQRTSGQLMDDKSAKKSKSTPSPSPPPKRKLKSPPPSPTEKAKSPPPKKTLRKSPSPPLFLNDDLQPYLSPSPSLRAPRPPRPPRAPRPPRRPSAPFPPRPPRPPRAPRSPRPPRPPRHRGA